MDSSTLKSNKAKKMEYGISENGFCLVCKKMMARTRAYQHSKTPRHQANVNTCHHYEIVN